MLSSVNEPIATYVLEFGYYKYIGQLTSKLNEHVRRHDIVLAPNVVRKKVRIYNDGEFSIQFNETLARILGFVYSTIYRPRVSLHVAPNQYNLSAIVLPTMYVYCDVLQHIVVGDITAPLLRIVDVKTANTSTKHQILNPPLYVPLHKNNFDTIDITIIRGKSVSLRRREIGHGVGVQTNWSLVI